MKNVRSNHAHPIVCLDAGHYGRFNRSPVVPAYSEAQMVWKLQLLLKAELECYGVEVRQTRHDQGRDMELTARGRKSDGCDLFISIHSNACGTESVDRTEAIYFVPRDGTDVDDRSKEIASMLAQTVYEVMDNNQRPKVYSKLASSDRNRDGVKNDNYYGVLHGAWMVGTPGVIIEHSFHTNARAATWLLDESNLLRLAQAEAKAIAEWFGVSTHSSTTSPEKPSISDAEQMYRIRTSWDNAASQIGAYRSLDGAKSACKEGYSVYDKDGNSIYTKHSEPKPVPESAPQSAHRISVDGIWGKSTTLALQKKLGVPYRDGVISGQSAKCRDKYIISNCIDSSGWQWVGWLTSGSATMKALQRLVGADDDGVMGRGTIIALQKFLGVASDGVMGRGTVKALQNWLNK